jgi:hypothetical protein
MSNLDEKIDVTAYFMEEIIEPSIKIDVAQAVVDDAVEVDIEVIDARTGDSVEPTANERVSLDEPPVEARYTHARSLTRRSNLSENDDAILCDSQRRLNRPEPKLKTKDSK